MNRQIKYIVVFLVLIIISSCGKGTKRAAVLSGNITEGIKHIEAEDGKIISKIAEEERKILNENWDVIYSKIEEKYKEKKSISDSSKFTQDDRRRIAANAARVRESILKEIEKKETNLIVKMRGNTDRVNKINEQIIKYIRSDEKLKKAQENINKLKSELVEVDISELQGLTESLLKRIK